jgi:cytochrome c-type biogenesis protein CcmH/NrfF
MPLPAFTARNVLLYLIGVVALLFAIYALYLSMTRARPRKQIQMQPGAHAVVLRVAGLRASAPSVEI